MFLFSKFIFILKVITLQGTYDCLFLFTVQQITVILGAHCIPHQESTTHLNPSRTLDSTHVLGVSSTGFRREVVAILSTGNQTNNCTTGFVDEKTQWSTWRLMPKYPLYISNHGAPDNDVACYPPQQTSSSRSAAVSDNWVLSFAGFTLKTKLSI